MNEFTKKELINILSCLDVCIADDNSDDNLINKIQSMIDNYDNHDPLEAIRQRTNLHGGCN